MATIWKILTRKKIIDPIFAEETRLSRVLNTFDLTALGVGSTLGVGAYVLAGHVAKDIAGPAVILSFLIAAIASVFAGLCYAEFGARAPRAGSAYIYSYVCVGEFIAFVVGWNLILEYVIGSASVAKALSLYLDQLINNTMQNTFIEIAPMHIPYMATYFDFFSFGISLLLSVALAFGMKESSWTNNIFTIINIGVLLFVIIAGSLKADPANWAIVPDHNATTNSTNMGKGGFFPFGFEGMIKGAATCFYGFVGFDCIATTGEEVKNPKRAIPISIIVSLFIIFLAYFGTSTVLTMMVPYYLQSTGAPIPYAFEHVGWYTAKWIVSIGAIFGLCASLFGAMFPLPRIIYAMANDSLVFKFLGKVNTRFQTPVIGTLLAGLLTGLMSSMFDLKQLVNMMSIGTLLAYTIVAASILLLRYSREESRQYMPVQTVSDSDDSENYTENKFDANSDEEHKIVDEQELLQNPSGKSVIGQIFNCGRHKIPTKVSETIVTVELFIYCIMCLLMGLSAMYLKPNIMNGEIWAIVLTSVVVFIAVVIVMSMVTQPTSTKELSFKVPLVPLIPALSILINVYLMLMLDAHTWIRFAVWMAIGLPIYYCSVRPYSEAQNKNVSNKSSIDYNISMVNSTQNGKMNGIANVAFVSDENVKQEETVVEKPRKTRAPPPPVKSEEEVDVMEIPSEITKLDEMLEEVSNSINSNAVNRKLSVGTLSDVSAVVSHEENVVAVVHRDNIVTPANSIPLPSPIDSNNKPLTYIEIDKVVRNDGEVVPQTNVEMQEQPQKRNNSVDSPLPPESFSSADSVAWESLTSENDKSDNLKNSSTETLPVTTTPPSTPLMEDEPTNDQVPLPPPLPFSLQPTEGSREEIQAVVRPTSENLNSVTLRPLKRMPKEDEELYEPDDDNLKVGSEKYKFFMASLSGKLQKPVRPTYIPYVKRDQIIEPVRREPNENVIEDSINQKEAKVKLGILGIDSILTRNDFAIDKEKQKEETDVEANDVKSEDGSSSGNSDYMEHKTRMQNVFRSINLKKSDSFKDLPLEESHRNVKSLGSSFLNDDKTQHRQAMSEIFKSIQLRRKDSKKQEDK